MVCCAVIAMGIAGALYLVRALAPGLGNRERSSALSWRVDAKTEG